MESSSIDLMVCALMTEKFGFRSVKSFVNRTGRLTKFQKRAINELLPVFSFPERFPTDQLSHFGVTRPLYVEIGFGDGCNLLNQAISWPNCSFLGCEIYKSGIGGILGKIQKLGINNVRIAVGDAVETVARFSPKSLDGISIFFPDPWPKKRHNKRRLVNASFLKNLTLKMKDHALLFLATDDRSYAYNIIDLVEGDGLLENIAGSSSFAPRPSWREITRFEQRALSQGNQVFEIIVGLKT